MRTAAAIVGASALVVAPLLAGPATASEGPHVAIAAPRTSQTARTIQISGATTGADPHLYAYWETIKSAETGCAATFAHRPASVHAWEWSDIVPRHSVELVGFERKESVHSGDRGELHLICAYLENGAGHVGAHARLSYRDPALS